ncbi:MAG TPA: beta-galactosidase, partial [Planctomycetota bacterium]|nr:beta-galactosidase [Planctomycetota bacterium]
MIRRTCLSCLTALFATIALAGEQRIVFDNPFPFTHPPQPVSSTIELTDDLLPAGTEAMLDSLNRHVGLRDVQTGALLPVQWSGMMVDGRKRTAVANYVLDLPANTRRELAIAGKLDAPAPASIPLSTHGEGAGGEAAIEVRSGRLAVRLAAGSSMLPPIVAVGRVRPQRSPADGQVAWRGAARFVDAGPVEAMSVEHSVAGPVFYRHAMTYRLALGTEYRCEITCWAGLDFIGIDETITGPGTDAAGWEIDLGNWDRAFQRANNRWCHDLRTIKPGAEIAMLVNYLMWNNPAEAAEVCLASDASAEMLDVFSIRRGEWVDKLHEPLALTPLGDHPEEPWSQRRWWGSPFGAIRIGRVRPQQSPGDSAGIVVRCNFTPGRRQWGIAIGDAGDAPAQLKSQYDPPAPASRRTAALGEVRLTEWQHRVFDWPHSPKVKHPRIEVTADELDGFARKAEADPFFARLAKLLEGNPVLEAWRTRDAAKVNDTAREIIKQLDRDVDAILARHFWLPGHRGIVSLASRADVLLGTGLVEPDIQQQLQQRFALLAYHCTDSSLMDWKYNAGHPNFDADRYSVPAMVAMLYPDHPDADAWLNGESPRFAAIRQFREALRIYVILESGKWAENIGNYYDWSAVVLGALAHGLRHTGSADPFAWPEWRDFWRWSLPTVMPPKPGRDDLARLERGEIPDPLPSPPAPSPSVERGEGGEGRRRERPSVGDHGRDGGHPFHTGYAIAGQEFLRHGDQLGRELLWLWTQGSRPIDDEHHSTLQHAPFQAMTIDAKSLLIGEDPKSAPPLASQRLAGYGTVFRADAGKPTESYLLFKCGPGGYRYHGEEASFVLFGLGQPLVLDGGEDGRPELHATITFGTDRSGVGRGRLVQFESANAIDYACGSFPGSAEQTFADPKSPAAVWTRDVLGRQILFRRNDYVVIRDRITAVQQSQWNLPLTCRENTDDGPGCFTAAPVPGLGNVSVRCTLFHIDNQTGAIRPVTAAAAAARTDLLIDAVERERFKHDVHQKRRVLRQPPGTSVIAVIDWYTRGRGDQPWPWNVETDGSRIILKNDKGTATEIIETSDHDSRSAAPMARWTRLEGEREVASWQNGESPRFAPMGERLPPIESVKVRDGMVYVNGKPMLANGWNTGSLENIAITPGPVLRWPKGRFLDAGEKILRGETVDLLKQEPAIQALEQAGKYAVLIIEPYWGRATPGQGQVSWRGEDRAGSGLNTNACWRNPDFIADRLEWLRRVGAAVRSEPRAHQRILGYIVWNEQRWAWGEETCYCPHCTAAWAKWLAARYKTIDTLNREYGTAFTADAASAFDDVPLPMPIDGKPLAETTKQNSRPTSVAPARDVTSVPAWRDFHLFKADGLIEFEKLGAAAMKKADPDRLVITSLFSRDVHPNIGHVMLRLYRELGADPNIDVIGGNSYEVLPESRSARHIAMWRSIPAAGDLPVARKPIWFTEFNDHGLPIDRPCTPAMINCLISRTAFSGCSGLIWFTDRTPEVTKFGVLETDGAISERWRTVHDAHAAMQRRTDLIVEAARNDLPRQIAIVHLDQWNALADNEYYDAASQSALNLLGIRCGYSVAYLAEVQVVGPELGRHPVAVLWQAQRQGDLNDAALRVLRKYVENGGMLICDLPLVQDADGRGPAGGWAEFAGLTFANEQTRNVLDISDPALGRIQLRASGTAFPDMQEPQSLGVWDVQPAAGTDVIADSTGHPAIVIRKLGKGRVATLCFKLALIDPDADNREMAAKLLRGLIGPAGVQPLVDVPWLEKTIAPLDGGGLLVTVFNGHDSAVNSPMHLPQHRAPKIE